MFGILKLRGYPIDNAKSYFRSIHRTSNIFDLQDDLKWKILNYHKTNNSFYKNFLPRHSNLSDWNNLPLLKKTNFQQNLKHLISNDFNLNELYLANTSGSSGHPFYFAKDKFCHALSYALIDNRYSLHGIDLQDKQARFYGIPINGKSRLTEQLKDLLANRIRFPVFDLSEKKLSHFLKIFKSQKFKYLYGYTSALVLFARYLSTINEILKNRCPSLIACIITSEACSIEDSLLLEKYFGVKILNEYGASELSIIAFPNTEGNWIISDETLYVEVLNDNDEVVPYGKEGKIVITSLYNRAMPFIRYEIGDTGIINKDKNTCLVKLTGRTNDVILLPSGRKAAGLTFYYVSRSILESSGVIKEFIIKQTSLETFIFEIVSARDLNKDEFLFLKKNVELYLEKDLQIIIKRVDKINRPTYGKIKHFYSEL